MLLIVAKNNVDLFLRMEGQRDVSCRGRSLETLDSQRAITLNINRDECTELRPRILIEILIKVNIY